MKYAYTILFALTLLLNVVSVNALLPPASNSKTQTQQKWNVDLYQTKAQKTINLDTLTKKDTKQKTDVDAFDSKPTTVHAILFAINDYKDRMPNLDGCVNDMDRVQDWLKETHEIKDGDIQVLTNNNASYAALTNALAKAKEQKVDRLVVMVSCHGGSFNGKSFIVPQDFKDMDFEVTEKNTDTLKTLRESNRLPLSDILDALKATNIPEVLLVLDACRDTQGKDESFMREFQDLMKNNTSFQKKNGSLVVITSCSFGQKAEEYSVNGKNYGKFMYFFTEGLEGKADFAGCYDNQVTLTEAYNYAYSQMGGSQTPEIFLASSSQNMILARYKEFATPENPNDESDLGFLLRTGAILCSLQYDNETNNQGLKAINCILENVPNNALALSIRGSVYRCQGNYNQALLDWGKIGQKLQIYAGAKGNARKQTYILVAPNHNAQKRADIIKRNTLFTISGTNGDYLQITEINNRPVQNIAWIHKSDVHWDYQDAGNGITATKSQGVRNYKTATDLNSPIRIGGAREEPFGFKI